MLYAQFYSRVPEGLAGAGRLVDGVGDRAVLVLDGRHNNETNLDLSKVVGTQRGYHGVALFRGLSLLHASRVTTIHQLAPELDDK